ncbi:gamma-glutamyl-gamma-aminobutyrate hydrolase family protein [Sphingomonas sp. RHCKR47]|uniref:gamma-glutamyl-gamma-aminobutyrate hydrolase family protein n=1 Tax=Sphingomonas citricola TaxID=2862498 RepID=UPI001CA48711|nr:gamma-glutamyl-gamma-aminobutyrate hydrolase family protein [Sphingomonas citricola]MBW6522747.1 gamma-glutamyl-gamma-aminobutyrate hydrolase family protein [Sphingomonas citricola]
MAAPRKPLIGVLCCNEVAQRPIQAVASRFVTPLAQHAGACVMLVPAVAEASDAAALSDHLDGLLLTGSRSNVAVHRYGGTAADDDRCGTRDDDRDEVALMLAGRMIERGKPVFGICRGLQELNVLFGGTLSREPCRDQHLRGGWDARPYAELFDHHHDVELSADGMLARETGCRCLSVNSVHEQAIDRLGGGLAIEAWSAGDAVVEAIAARPCGAEVLAVQWHPEWDVAANAANRGFFTLLGRALHRSAAVHRGVEPTGS